MIYEILEELNLENGSNYKKAVLEKYKDNELLKRVLKMANDKVSFTYGVTMKNIDYVPGSAIAEDESYTSLESALDELETSFCTRLVTGNNALTDLTTMLEELDFDDAYVIERILDRDLKIRLGRTEINKVFKNLIV